MLGFGYERGICASGRHPTTTWTRGGIVLRVVLVGCWTRFVVLAPRLDMVVRRDAGSHFVAATEAEISIAARVGTTAQAGREHGDGTS